jgi:hypothetical protein
VFVNNTFKWKLPTHLKQKMVFLELHQKDQVHTIKLLID